MIKSKETAPKQAVKKTLARETTGTLDDTINSILGIEKAKWEEIENMSKGEFTKRFKGNSAIKKAGAVTDLTFEQIMELDRCRQDPVYFIEKYCKIISLDKGLVAFNLYEPQKRFISTVLDNRNTVVMQPRQTGKTATTAALLVWYSIFNQRYAIAIAANRQAAAREVLYRFQLIYENLPFWLQIGVKEWNKGSLLLDNGSSVKTFSTTAAGLRGQSINFLYIDEFAVIANHIAEEFITATMPVVSAGETTKVLITSTPIGFNHFWKIWNDAVEERNGYAYFRVFIDEIPGRGKEWQARQRKELGPVRYKQEVDCDFLGSSNTLISATALSNMSAVPPLRESNEGTLKFYKFPQDDRHYLITVDPATGVGADYSVMTVIDITSAPYEVCAIFRDNNITTGKLVGYLNQLATDYNRAYVLIESNMEGARLADLMWEDFEYENVLGTYVENSKTCLSMGAAKFTKGIRTNKGNKKIGCFALKDLIENDMLPILDDILIEELSRFIDHGNGSFSADVGHSDDIVMSLVLFGWLTTDRYFRDLTNIDVRKRMFEESEQKLADTLVPLRIVTATTNLEESFVDATNTFWEYASATDKGIPWVSIYDDPFSFVHDRSDMAPFRQNWDFGQDW